MTSAAEQGTPEWVAHWGDAYKPGTAYTGELEDVEAESPTP